jgi:protein TonB
VRRDTQFGLALAGTLLIHAAFLAGAGAVIGLFPREPEPVTPRIELVEIEVPPVLKPPPPPVPEPEPERPRPPEPAPKQAPKPAVRAVQPARPAQPETPPPPTQPPAPTADPGGAPTVSMPDIAPAATGVAVAPGPRNTGKVGRGGGGTGTGAGSGAGDPPPAPVSIASIKTPARVKGDYDYTKDYPAEARRLGIEGDIRVRLTVDDKGKVKAAVLLNQLGHGLDEFVLAHARQIEFEPAKDTDDRPVSSFVVWTFHMILPK